ncbi:MAG: diaminopimelate epimerase [Halothermotrichaceae bacterium]
MNIDFTKMHGAGNDFIMVNGFKDDLANYDYSKIASKLCNRHFAIGADGLIIVLPAESRSNDFKMRIFNSDGSEAEMCGNGIRCFAHFLQEEGLTEKTSLNIETLAGIISPQLISYSKKASKVKVNMGQPRFKPAEIPIKLDEDLENVQDFKLKAADNVFDINCVSMGNPHTVIFVDDIEQYKLNIWGEKIENHEIFPEKTNVEFIEKVSSDEIVMKVWERGAGITLACGTGAAAAVAAGIKKGILNDRVLVHLPGGDLIIEWSDQDVFMTGPSEKVFKGEIKI